MKRLTIAVTAAVATISFAQISCAAGVPYSWTGFYAGMNAGYGWSASNDVSSAATPVFAGPTWNTELTTAVALATGADPVRQDGFIGGDQIGYNFQFNSVVVGVEADIQGANIKGTSPARQGTGVPTAFPNELITSTSTSVKEVNWLGTVRGRLGFLATPSILLYGTGGLAYGGVSASTSMTQFDANNGVPGNAPYSVVDSVSRTLSGWTLGAGVEWMLAQHWTVRAEYLYYDLGKVTYGGTLAYVAASNFNQGYTVGLTHTTQFDGQFVRFAVNYKFSP